MSSPTYHTTGRGMPPVGCSGTGPGVRPRLAVSHFCYFGEMWHKCDTIPSMSEDTTYRGLHSPLAFARVMRTFRERKGLTQQELAQLAGVSRYTIMRLEDPAGDIRMSSLVSVVSVLGLELALATRTSGSMPGACLPERPDW